VEYLQALDFPSMDFLGGGGRMKRCKGRHRRLLVGLTVSTTVLFVLSPGIALADEIVDPPDATVDTVAPTVDATADTVEPTLDVTVDTVEPTPVDTVEPTPVDTVDSTTDATIDTLDSTTDATIDTVDSTSDSTTETVTDPIVEVVSEPAPETATEPFPEVVSDPIDETVTDSTTETVTDPIVEVVSEPAPEVASEPLPTPISEPVPAPVASAPEPEVPATVDETPMTVTATTELFSSEDSASPRITSEELPQKLQDDSFNSPQLEGIGHTQTVLMVTSSQAIVGSKAGSVQVDGPVSCSGAAPCGVRNSPNDPGSFVESIAELLRQLALTGSGALDLMKLALILAFVGAFAIWGTRRRPITSGIDQKRTLRSGGLLHRHHRTMTIVSDRQTERTTPHVVVRQRPTRRVRLAAPQVVPASGRSAARVRSSESGSVARVSSCPATTDRSESHLVLALREDRE
jgi:hypothetical protein